jgi:hypothetical protein
METVERFYNNKDELYDANGELKPNVEVYGITEDGKQENVTEEWRKFSHTEPTIEQRDKPIETPKDYLGEDVTSDYFDLRNLMRNKTANAMMEHMKKVDRKRLIVIREHLLASSAYNKESSEICDGVIKMITRAYYGDFDLDEDFVKMFDSLDLTESESESEEIIEATERVQAYMPRLDSDGLLDDETEKEFKYT